MFRRELVALITVFSPALIGQVFHLKEMNTGQLRSLNRSKTAVFLTIGILEQHGPYMPSFTDGYAAERHTIDIASAIIERPGWQALIFPTIPLGSSAANEIGGKYTFDGSYTVRTSTLRSILMDLGTELGEGGFRWIFVVHPHGGGGGALNNSRAVDQACDYFRETYGGHMVNLLKLVVDRTPEDRQRLRHILGDEGFCPHACGSEISRSLYLHPQLVDPGYRSAPTVNVRNWTEAAEAARRQDWQGYFGAPSAGSAWAGAQLFKLQSQWLADLALRILDGFDYTKLPRYSDVFGKNAEIAPINSGALEYEDRMEKRQSEWLRKKGLK